MSSVDERVVEMRFDNAQFERGVKKTLSSLDKLKEGLKFDGILNGANTLSNIFSGFKLNNINKTLNDVDSTVSKHFSAMGIAGEELVKRIANAAITTTTKVVSAIPKQIKNGGWSRALNIENAKFQLNGLGVAWDKINNDIQYAVNGTAYGLDAAAKVAGQLAASGIQVSDSALTATKSVDDFAETLKGQTSAAIRSAGSTDEMATALRSISGVAAMTNSSFEDIGQIYTRVAGQGRVMATDLNSIAARGINAASTLGKYLGKTESEVRDMVSKGEIDFQTFSDAMYDAFADHAVEANNTFEGALANTKSALSRIGADVADDVLPAATKVLNSLRTMFNQVHKWIQPVLDAIGRLATTIGDTLSPIIDSITAKISKLTGVTGGPIEQIAGLIDKAGEKVKAFGKLFGFGVDEAADSATDAAAQTNTAIESVNTSAEHLLEMANRVIRGDFGNQPVRQQNLEAIGESYELIQNKVNELLGCDYRYEVQAGDTAQAVAGETQAVNDQAQAVESAAEKTKDYQQYLQNVTKGHMLNGLLNIGNTLRVVFSSLAESIKDVASRFDKTKFFEKLEKFSEGFDEFTGKIVNSTGNISKVKQVISDVVEGIADILTGIVQRFEILGEAIYETISEINGVDPTKTSGAFKDLASSFVLSDDAASGLKDVLKLLLSPLKLIVPLLQKVTIFAMKVATAFEKVTHKFLEFVHKSKLLNSLQKLFEKIGKTLKDIFERVKDSEGFKKLVESAKELKDAIGTKLTSLLDTLADKLSKFADSDYTGNGSSGLDAFVNFISTASEKISSALDKLTQLVNGDITPGEFFASVGEAIAEGLGTLAGYIKQGVEDIGTTLSGIDFSKAWKSFKQTVSEKISSLNFGEVFSSIKEAFKKGFEKSTGSVIGSSDSSEGYGVVATAIHNNLIGDPSKLQSSADQITADVTKVTDGIDWDAIGESFKKGFGNFLDTVSGVLTDSRIELITSTIMDFIKAIVGLKTMLGLASALKGFGKMTSGLGDLFKSLSGGLGGLLESLKGNVEKKDIIGDLKRFAVAIAILVGSIATLTILNSLGLDVSKSIIELTAIVGALIGVMTLLGKSKIDFTSTSSFSKSVLGLSVAIFLLVPTLALLSVFKKDTFEKSLIRFAEVLGILAGIYAIMAMLSKYQVKGSAFVGMAVAITLSLIPLAILAKIKDDTYKNGITRFATILILFGGVIALIGALTKKKISGGAILAMGVDILAIVVALKALAKMPFDSIRNNAILLSAVLLAMGVALRVASKGIKKDTAKTLLSATLLVVAIAVSLEVLSLMNFSKVMNSAIMLAGVILVVSKVVENAAGLKKGSFKPILSAVVLVLAVAGSIILLSKYEDSLKNTAVAALALSVVLLAIAAAFKSFGEANRVNYKSVLSMVAVVVAIGASLTAIATQPWQSILAAGAAMSAVMIIVTKALGSMKASKTIVTPALAMAVTIVAIGASLTAIATQPWQQILAAGLVMSAVMIVLTKAMGSMKVSKTVIGPALAMAVMVVAIGASLAILANQPWDSILAAGLAMSAAIASVVVAIALLSKIKIGSAGSIAVSLLSMSVAIIAIAAALTLLSQIPFGTLMGSVLAFSVAIGVMTAALVVLSLVSPALAAVGVAILAMGAAIGIAAVGIGAGMLLISLAFQNVSSAIADFITQIAPLSDTLPTLADGLMSLAGAGAVSGLAMLPLAVGMAAVSAAAPGFAAGVSAVSDAINKFIDVAGRGSAFFGTLFANDKLTKASEALKEYDATLDEHSSKQETANKKTSDSSTKATNNVTKNTEIVKKSNKDLSNAYDERAKVVSNGRTKVENASKSDGTLSKNLDETTNTVKTKTKEMVDSTSDVGDEISNNVIPSGMPSMFDQLFSVLSSKTGLGVEDLKTKFASFVNDSGQAGTDSGNAFGDNMSSTLEGFISSLGGDLSGSDLTSIFGEMGTESGTNFIDSLKQSIGGDSGIDVDSIFSQFTESSSQSGTESGQQFGTNFSDSLKQSIGGDSGIDVDSIFSQFTDTASQSGTESGTNFSDSLKQSLGGDSGIDVDSIFSQFTDTASQSGTESGQQFGTSFGTGISDSSGDVTETSTAVADSAVQGFSDRTSDVQASGKSVGEDFALGVNSATPDVRAAAKQLILNLESVLTASNISSDQFETLGKSVGSKFSDELNSSIPGIQAKTIELVSTVTTQLSGMTSEFTAAGTNFGNAFATGLFSAVGRARAAGMMVAQNATNGFRIGSSYAYQSGVHFVENLANGITAAAPKAVSAASAIASSIHEVIGHSTPKKGPMKDDDVWGKHFVDNLTKAMKRRTPNLTKQVTAIAQIVRDYLGHTSPKKGPLKNDSKWGEHLAENFANGILRGGKKVEGAAKQIASEAAKAVWDAVDRKDKTTTQIEEQFISDMSSFISDKKDMLALSYQDEVNYWDEVLKYVTKGSKAYYEAIKNRNDALYNNAEEYLEDKKDQYGDDLTNEAEYWSELLKITDEGSDGYKKIYDKMQEAFVSDTKNMIKAQQKLKGELSTMQAPIWEKQIEYAEAHGANQKTLKSMYESLEDARFTDVENQITKSENDVGEKLFGNRYLLYYKAMKQDKKIWDSLSGTAKEKYREKAGEAYLKDVKAGVQMMKNAGSTEEEIMEYLYQRNLNAPGSDEMTAEQRDELNDKWQEYTKTVADAAKDRLDVMKRYYDISSTDEALYWRGVMSTMQSNTEGYAQAEQKFLDARKAAWDEYTSAVENYQSKLNSEMLSSSEFGSYNEQSYDILADFRNRAEAIQEFSQHVSDVTNRGFSDDVIAYMKDAFGVKDTWAWIALANYSSEEVSELNDLVATIKSASKDTAEDINSGLKPDFLYTDDEVQEIASSITKVMDVFTSVSGDDKWRKTIDENLKNMVNKPRTDNEDAWKKEYTSMGSNLIRGTIQGITMQSPALASAVASAVANAIAAAKAVAGIASPSKVMRGIGGYMGEGLVLGMKDWYGDIEKSGDKMGSLATNSVEYAIGSTDISPVIKPVLDLSEVEDGASSINSMFSEQQSVQAAVGMERYKTLQNGSNVSTTDNSIGAINVQIYAAEGQNANDISDAVIKKLNNEIIRKRKVYA